MSDGTVPVITDGCTKIDAPMMMPTTSAVAWSGVIDRESMRGTKLPTDDRAARGERGCPRLMVAKLSIAADDSRPFEHVPCITPETARCLQQSQLMMARPFARRSAK